MEQARPPWSRVLAFAVLGTWVVFGPATAQVLHLPPPSHGWQMYSAVGRFVCDVQYYERTDAGDLPVDYREVLHGRTWYDLEPFRRRIMQEDLGDVSRSVCRKGRIADLRADATCAGRRDWEVVLMREDNLCRAPARRKRK